MSDFVYLISATDVEGCSQIFTVPDGVAFPVAGDLVEHEGEFFPITESTILDKNSPEYRIIDSLCTIFEAEAVFTRRWTKEEIING